MENNLDVSPSLFVKKLTVPQFRFKTPENFRHKFKTRFNLDSLGSRVTCSRKFEQFHTEPDDLTNKSYQKETSSNENTLKTSTIYPLSLKSRNIPRVDLTFSFKSKITPRINKKPQKSSHLALESAQGPRFRLESRETSYDHDLYQSFFQSPTKIVGNLQASQQYSKGMQKLFQQQTLVLSYPKKL